MYVHPTTVTEIKNVIKKIKKKSTTGPDEIPYKIIHEIIDDIVEPLKNLINKSFEKCKFPQNLKLSKNVPIPKKKGNILLNDLRPLALTSVFSKILERIIFNRLVDFLDKFNVVSSSQHAYRKGRSCNTAVFELTNIINKKISNKKKRGILFLDLSKAFDTVPINLLCRKLEMYG